MLGEPVQKLRHGVDLVVEMAVRELDHLVDQIRASQGAASGSATMPLRMAFTMLVQSADLISWGDDRFDLMPCSVLMSEISAGPWPVALHENCARANRLLNAEPRRENRVPCLLAQ